MSRQSDSEWRILGGYRRIYAAMAISLLVAIFVHYTDKVLTEAQEISLRFAVTQFSSRLQQLHGKWLNDPQPNLVTDDAITLHFNNQGWPVASSLLLNAQSSADNSDSCLGIWQSLMPTNNVPWLRIMVEATADGDGCTISSNRSSVTWLYHFADGELKQQLKSTDLITTTGG